MTDTTPSTPTPALVSDQLRARLTRASGSLRALGTLVALGIIWLVFSLQSKYFFTTPNIWNILLQAANVGIIAAGLTVVMIAAEIDLSIGSLEALSGSVAAVIVIEHGYSPWRDTEIVIIQNINYENGDVQCWNVDKGYYSPTNFIKAAEYGISQI